MGEISHEATGRRVQLQSENLVGRSARCTLRIQDEHVSSEHASIRWNGSQWVLKDLGSLNRTSLGSRTLSSSEIVTLSAGEQVSFGSPAQTWTLADASAPGVMALPEDGGDCVVAIGGLLPLPSSEDPQITLHRDQHGAWVLDSGTGIRHVADQEWVEAAGQRFRLSLPQVFAPTAPLSGFVGKRVADLAITFRVSPDLEQIELDVRSGSVVQTLSPRGHNEMLLILARTRKQDAAQGIPPANCGWMYQDELCRAIAVEPERLNVDVYRVRQVFAELGLLDPAHIIERRSKSRQLRIGTDLLEEMSL